MNGIALRQQPHYHNSVSALGLANNETKYRPSTAIKTETLTDKYTIKGEIGRGKFAVVRKCINNETGEEVAAKFIRKRRKGKSCRDEILREVVMLELGLEHPRLVDLKEVFETQTELILITEYCAGGELFTECVIEESFSEADVVRFLAQILEGLDYLHERNIVHLDLKPQNILFTKPFPHGDIKVCDLGFACLVNTGEDIRDIIGTPDYVAPEVLSYEPLGLYTDMWSLGVLTYVMLTAHSPFAGKDNQETFLNISQVNLDFPESLFKDTSPLAQDFITKLLVKDPEERLTAKQCLQHPWVAGRVDPEKILEISIEEKGEMEDCDKSVFTNQDKESEFSVTNENSSECEPSNQSSENSRLNKENPEEVLKESLKENISTEKDTCQEKDLKKLILCSNILDKVTEENSSSMCNENIDTSVCHSCKHISDWSSTGEDNMELAEDIDNKVSLV
ncbi:serine/threonine-protein kinase 17B-like [Saccostrea echinata]|uniref:serine/threonine-protein kinase 17B-like n=1 Tax=Saccostrea echinata TaxID=191078 RepID=UPI002A80FB79|nr:serine/threonine-protein kinase 17B-like [Saccostrea echinata]